LCVLNFFYIYYWLFSVVWTLKTFDAVVYFVVYLEETLSMSVVDTPLLFSFVVIMYCSRLSFHVYSWNWQWPHFYDCIVCCPLFMIIQMTKSWLPVQCIMSGRATLELADYFCQWKANAWFYIFKQTFCWECKIINDLILVIGQSAIR